MSFTKIEIDLTFKKPLEVSQGSKPDLMIVHTNLAAYPDENGQKLPQKLIKMRQIPAQIGSVEVEEVLDSIELTISTSVSAASAGTTFVSILTSASLNHLWSLLNSL